MAPAGGGNRAMSRRLQRPPSPRVPTRIDLQAKTCILTAVSDEADKVFKALADPGRRALLDRLFEKEGQTLGALADGMGMTRQAVSQHLAILEAANLVATRRQGREKLHYLNPVPIHEIHARWIAKFERPRLDALAALKASLEGDSDG